MSLLRRVLVMACILLLLVYTLFPWELSADPLRASLLDTVLTRGLCSAAFLLALIERDSPILRPLGGRARRADAPSSLRRVLLSLPWLAIAINNLAILPLLDGSARVTGGWQDLLLFALGCFFIGVFEETAFRGVIFPLALSRFGKTPRGIFLSICTTSAIFGLFHLVNLFIGADPLAVLLQVGYSFLIGGMCAICLVKTGSIWYPILLHALYDFNGYLVPTLGEGLIWTTASIVLTVVVSLLVFAYTLWVLFKIKPEEVADCL